MFILWHGFGWLVVAFLVASYWLLQALLPGRSEDLAIGLSYICASVPCWFVGRYFRDNYTIGNENKETGQRVRVRQPYHALFFIPMHFWAPICLTLGVFVLAYPSSQKRSHSHSQDIAVGSRAWSTFASPAGDFSISAPAQLVDKSEELQYSFGTIHRHRYCTSMSGAYFGVERSDYPEGVISTRPVSEVLDGARDGAVAAIDGRLLAEVPTSLGSNVGRELEIQTSKKTLVALSRIYVMGDHLYSLIVVTPSHDKNSPSVERFFDSFRITREL